jgi:hypothetical protein
VQNQQAQQQQQQTLGVFYRAYGACMKAAATQSSKLLDDAPPNERMAPAFRG